MAEASPPLWIVTGGTGQVGCAIPAAAPDGAVCLLPTRAMLDLAQPAHLPDALAELAAGRQVSAVISCGAYTAVDRAESEPALADAINHQAPRRLAQFAASAGAVMIHVSTDYVFAGTGDAPHAIDAPVRPLGVYGASKAAGEAAVRASGARHAIVRTSWVVSVHGQNFIKTMLRLGGERDTLSVVADQIGAPTNADDLARALTAIAGRFLADPEQPSGTWHYANSGATSWHGLANHVFARAAARGARVPAAVLPIPTRDYPTPAQRPLNSRLDISALNRDFGIAPRPWQDATGDIVDQLLNAST